MLSVMGNKDARKRETKKPKKQKPKPEINPPMVRKISSKP
jgi:hypothetical protein